MSIQKTIAHSFSEIKSILLQFDDKMYQKEIDIISNSSIGQHFRHIIEFYQCFIEAQDKDYVCYDERQRNFLWETSIIESLKIINHLNENLKTIDLDKNILLKQNYYGQSLIINSTNQRELAYCFDHSIHHFAIIKIAVSTNFPFIKLPENFGVASSTISFHKNEK